MAVMSGISGIPDMARVWSRATPEKVALIDTDRVVTYAELEDRSNRIANRLVAADIRPGSHVGYLGKNSAAFFEVWVGANKAGCALAPLNWRNAAAELTVLVRDAKVPQRILRCDQAAIEAMWGYALCGGNTTVMERSPQFFDKVDRSRAGATASAL